MNGANFIKKIINLKAQKIEIVWGVENKLKAQACNNGRMLNTWNKRKSDRQKVVTERQQRIGVKDQITVNEKVRGMPSERSMGQSEG